MLAGFDPWSRRETGRTDYVRETKTMTDRSAHGWRNSVRIRMAVGFSWASAVPVKDTGPVVFLSGQSMSFQLNLHFLFSFLIDETTMILTADEFNQNRTGPNPLCGGGLSTSLRFPRRQLRESFKEVRPLEDEAAARTVALDQRHAAAALVVNCWITYQTAVWPTAQWPTAQWLAGVELL